MNMRAERVRLGPGDGRRPAQAISQAWRKNQLSIQATLRCETAWGLDADRRRKALICLGSEGSCCRADRQPPLHRMPKPYAFAANGWAYEGLVAAACPDYCRLASP